MVSSTKKRQRGEGIVSHIIVLAIVVLVCVTAAATLSGSIQNLLGKTGKKVDEMGTKIDGIKVK